MRCRKLRSMGGAHRAQSLSRDIVYERHFGITGPPFQLSPDPFFFFESDQHRDVLKAMREALSQALPFFVLSGEVGAGKTTLVQTLVAEARADGIPVAQITNTQLNPNELVGGICSAFGIPTAFGLEAEPLVRLKPFLQELSGCLALIVVDEAQNLSCEALRCLVDLSVRAAKSSAALHFYLVGQPALQVLLEDPSVAELRAMTQQSVHLGPLRADQIQRYIEHRLGKVGWTGIPSFSPGVFDDIYEFTGGLPRRINVLCNRLMLSRFLSRSTVIDARAVFYAASELNAEMGGGAPRKAIATVPRPVDVEQTTPGLIFIVASGRSDHVKAVPLLLALAGRPELPPAVLVSVSDDSEWDLDRHWHASVGLTSRRIKLSRHNMSAEVAFHGVIDRHHPCAVIVLDGNSISKGCAHVAHGANIPLIHVGSDPQSLMEQGGIPSARHVIRRLARVCYCCQPPIANDEESPDPIPSVYVGNLLVDAVHMAVHPKVSREGDQWTPSQVPLDNYAGYGVVAVKESGNIAQHATLALLREVSRDLPLVWPSRRAFASDGGGLFRELAGHDVACIGEVGHIAFIRLLRHATCVLTDSFAVQEEAATLGVPCLLIGDDEHCHIGTGNWLPGLKVGLSPTRATWAVWEVLFNVRPYVQLPSLWDGNAAVRVAAHLSGWLDTLVPEAMAPSNKPTSLMPLRVRFP